MHSEVADYCSSETNKWMNLIDEDCYFLISPFSLSLSFCIETMNDVWNYLFTCEKENIYMYI